MRYLGVRSIREIGLKIKAGAPSKAGNGAHTVLRDWGLFILVILAVTGAFGLGRLSVLTEQNKGILVQNRASEGVSVPEGDGTLPYPIKGVYVASKTGSRYYFPWCTDALKIAPELRRWFIDEKAAQKAGYTPATNCRGMSGSEAQ